MDGILLNIFYIACGGVGVGLIMGYVIYHGNKQRSLGREDVLDAMEEEVEENAKTTEKLEKATADFEKTKMRGKNSLPSFYAIKKIQTTTIYGHQYDIVLSFEIVQFLVMLIMQGWDISFNDVQKDILDTIDEHKTEFPPGTNTIIVRRIQLNQDQTGTYYLEPVVNPAVKSIIT